MVALTWFVLLAAGAVLWTAGLVLGRPDSCTGPCEWGSFALMFAGTPISGAITLAGTLGAAGAQDLVLAWPVDALAWFGVAVMVTRLTDEAPHWTPRWNRMLFAVLVFAVLFGGLLALGVARVR